MELLRTMDQRLSAYDPMSARVQLVRFAIMRAQRSGAPEDIAKARAAFAELEPEIAAWERRKRLEAEAAELAQVEAELEAEAFGAELQRRGSMSGAEVRQWHRAYDRRLWGGGGRVMDLTKRPSYDSPVSVVRARKVNLQAQGQAQRGEGDDAPADGLGRNSNSNGKHNKPTGESTGAGTNPPVD